MLVKVCGISDPEFIDQIDELTIDFTGFIFYPTSKRFVGDKLSAEQLKSIPNHIKKVGVFVNERKEHIFDIVENYQLDLVQLHGEESASYLKTISKNVPVIKAFRIDESFNFSSLTGFEDASTYFLFDTKGRLYGGTGKKFNWQLLQKYQGNTPFLLSGGITPSDAEIINELSHPKCVGIDINSGFEKQPGIKNIVQIKEFLNQIK